MKKCTPYFLIFLVCLLSGIGCKTYKQETLDPGDFYSSTPVQHTIGKYDVYVHDGQNSYKIANPVMNGDTITGQATKVNSAALTLRPKGRKELAKHRKELNIYLKNPINPASLNGPLLINKADVARTDVVVKNKKSIFAIFAGIVLLVLLVAALIYGLIVLAVKGSDESSNQSNDSSADSSNDSSKGSGCYVATMVYGSYEAPEVLVLRKFRDQVLANYWLGRLFINWYYAHSPSFVERYKNSPKMNNFIRFLLDGLIRFLS